MVKNPNLTLSRVLNNAFKQLTIIPHIQHLQTARLHCEDASEDTEQLLHFNQIQCPAFQSIQ